MVSWHLWGMGLPLCWLLPKTWKLIMLCRVSLYQSHLPTKHNNYALYIYSVKANWVFVFFPLCMKFCWQNWIPALIVIHGKACFCIIISFILWNGCIGNAVIISAFCSFKQLSHSIKYHCYDHSRGKIFLTRKV